MSVTACCGKDASISGAGSDVKSFTIDVSANEIDTPSFSDTSNFIPVTVCSYKGTVTVVSYDDPGDVGDTATLSGNVCNVSFSYNTVCSAKSIPADSADVILFNSTWRITG